MEDDRSEGEQFPIELVNAAGASEPANVIVVDTRDAGIAITLRWADQQIVAEADDAFAAFCAVREQLGNGGLMPRCYGACRNFVISSMSIVGLKGYLVQMGNPALILNVVGIFDAGPNMDLTSVAEQQEFMKAWSRSLGRKADQIIKSLL